MTNGNIISFEKEVMKKKLISPDKKLSYLLEILDTMNLSIDSSKFMTFSKPKILYHSILFLMLNSTAQMDLKLNFMFCFLDKIKSPEKNTIASKSTVRADYIFLNILNQLFERHFSGRKLDCNNFEDLRNSLCWLDNDIEMFCLLYYAYVNGDLNAYKLLSDLAIKHPIAFQSFSCNFPLFYGDFMQSLPKESFHQILHTLTADPSVVSPPLNDQFYQYAGKFCQIDPNYFSKRAAFFPFFSDQTEDIIEIFGIDRLIEMDEEEITYISFQAKEILEEIRSLLDVEVPITKIKKISCYPPMVQLGYQKVKLIQKVINSKKPKQKNLQNIQ